MNSEKKQGLFFYIRELIRNQSIFNRIFFGLMSMFIILILTVTFWINHISARSQQRLIMQNNLSRMQAADRTVTQVFDDLTASMTQLLWNQEMLSYLLLPVPEDQTRYYRISQELSNVARSIWGVKEIFFYSDYTGKVFHSSAVSVYDLSGFYDAFLFETDWETDDAGSLYANNQDRKTRTWLITSQGRLFLLQNLYMGKSLGSVAYEMNTSIVSTLMSGGSWQEGQIFPYDRKGRPVLSSAMNYSRMAGMFPEYVDTPDPKTTVTVSNVESFRVNREEAGYLVYGNRVPWIYLMKLNPADMRVSLRSTITTWFPAILLLFVISAAITLYVIRSIYAPVNRLMELAGQKNTGENRTGQGDGGEKKKRKNEFDVLESAYSRVISREAEVSRLLESVSSDALEGMLVNLLNGRSGYTTEELADILTGMGSSLPVAGRFLLCVCVMEDPKDRRISDEERDMYRMSFLRLVRPFTEKEYLMHPVRMDPETLVLLLSFPEDVSAVNIKKAFIEIQRTLEQQAELLPYSLWVESGQIYSRLTDSREAYREGLERIRFRRESLTAGKTAAAEEKEGMQKEEEEPAAEKKALSDHFRMREQTEKISSLAAKGEPAAADLMTEQVLRDIGNVCGVLPEEKDYCEKFLEALAEKALAYPLTEEEKRLADVKEAAEEIRRMPDRESLHVFVQERCRKICRLIYAYNRKNRYKYVDQAKEYIADHYIDSSLALNDVAEHIGISASYLSELWSEQGGDKFSGYLALYRVEKSRKLLQETALPVKEIGVRCGFNSVQNFNRVFKKFTGVTPGQYRDSGQETE